MQERVKSPRVEAETAAREEWNNKLQGLEGFKKLSEKQQQMIRLSLYAHQRHERSKDDRWKQVGTLPNGKPLMQRQKTEYEKSHEHIWSWYCHAVVEAVRTEDASGKARAGWRRGAVEEGDGISMVDESEFKQFCESEVAQVGLPPVPRRIRCSDVQAAPCRIAACTRSLKVRQRPSGSRSLSIRQRAIVASTVCRFFRSDSTT